VQAARGTGTGVLGTLWPMATVLYHVSASVNRASNIEHGLDWRQTPGERRTRATRVAPLLASALTLMLLASGSAVASVPRCSAAHLKAWAGPVQGNMGTDLAEFAFINTSSKECSLVGYPRLQMVNGAGQRIATTDRDSPVSAFPEITRKAVVLAKGKRAYFGVFYPDHTGSGTIVCPTAAALELTPPGSTQAVTLRGSGAAITPYAGSNTALGCGLVQPTLVSAKSL